MRVWRLCHAAHRDMAFTGEGAREYGGRWNPRGIAVVYTSATLSLAALETLVHVGVATLPDEFVAVPADLPDDLQITERSAKGLPTGWREPVDHESLQEIGAAWIKAGKTAVLSVPSAIVPEERNYLLNPLHKEFAKIRRGRIRPFSLDTRLIRLQTVI